MDLLKSLAQADIGSAISDVDLKMAQARGADQQTEMTAEQVRALRFKQEQEEQEQARMDQVLTGQNIVDTIEQAMPGATPVLVQHAKARGYIDEYGGITRRNLYRFEEDMKTNPALVQGILNGRVERVNQTIAALQTELSSPDAKLKDEDRAIKQKQLFDARSQALALHRNKNEIDKAIAAMSGKSAAQYASGEIPAGAIEDRSSESVQTRLQGIQETNQAKREAADIRASKAAQDQIIKQDAILATDERNRIDNLTRIQQGKPAVIIPGLGGSGTVSPPDDPSKHAGYVNQLQAELEVIKGKRAALQDKLHSGTAPQSARGGLEVKGNFKDEAELAAAVKAGEVARGDKVIVGGRTGTAE